MTRSETMKTLRESMNGTIEAGAYVSAQPEPFLKQKHTLITPDTS